MRCLSEEKTLLEDLLRLNESSFKASDFSDAAAHTIVSNFLADVDVRAALDPRLSLEAIEEILSCMEDGIPIEGFVDYRYSADAIRLIKMALLKGLDVNQIADPSLSYDKMRARYDALSTARSMQNEYSICSSHDLKNFLNGTIKKLAVF